MADDAARMAYLFQCGDTDLFAIALDGTGASIPTVHCAQPWFLREQFPLGVQHSLPINVNPELVLAGLVGDGYFVWRNGGAAKPTGGSP
jgi:hypothetical protein